MEPVIPHNTKIAPIYPVSFTPVSMISYRIPNVENITPYSIAIGINTSNRNLF